MAKTLLGVDIGADRLKLALCRGGQVLKSAVELMPEGLIRAGQLTSPDGMGALLKDVMKRHRIRASEAAMILPGEQSYLRVVNMALMKREQLEVNLPFEFSDYISDDLKNYVYDYAVLGDPRKSEDGHMELMAVAAPRTLLEESRALLKKARLKLARFAPAECAYIALFQKLGGEDFTGDREYCVVDLGYNAIRVYMFRGERHIVTRRLDQGLDRLDEAMALLFDVDKAQGHQYFITNHENCNDSEVARDLYDGIGVELMRSLNFYRFSTPDSQLEDMWLCGGAASIDPLYDVIRETLGIRVHRAGELLQGRGLDTDANSLVRAVSITIE